MRGEAAPIRPLPSAVDVAVIGAGVIGLSLARELCRRGLEVAVLERGAVGDPGLSASAAAAGRIHTQAHPHLEPEPVRELSLASRHLFEDFVEGLETETGFSCEYDVHGGLTVALSDAEEVQLDRAVDWQRARALPFEVLAAEEARAREPSLGPSVQAAFSFPHDGHLSPERLVRALALGCRGAGVELLERTPAISLRLTAGRVAGVETGGGFLAAEAVVTAAGAWCGLLGGLAAPPVEPVRGSLVLLDASGDPDRLTRFVHAPGVYLVPRRDGTLLIGSTEERAGFDPRPSAGAVAGIVGQAARVVPAVLGYPVLRCWGGLRPVTPDGVPILGETAVPGAFLATGHADAGLRLAPATAHLLADLVTGRRPSLPPGPYSPARFGL